MTHQADHNVVETVVQLLCENGLSDMADAMRLMLNEAMRIERSQALAAAPYQRTENRQGYANGFKPKTVHTRLGDLTLEVPQVRGAVEFYPSALERGVRSERALKCAIAEMYVQGVSTRKVTEVMRELCGLEVSSTQVSRATKLLDEELTRWRHRPLSEVPYVFLDARYEKMRHAGSVVSCAVLMAFGVDYTGHRTVPGRQRFVERSRGALARFLRPLAATRVIRCPVTGQRRSCRPESGAGGAISRRALAALSVSPPAECRTLRAAPRNATRSRRRPAGHL
jgi:putative transposase